MFVIELVINFMIDSLTDLLWIVIEFVADCDFCDRFYNWFSDKFGDWFDD